MVQNAGSEPKNEQNKRCERLEIVVYFLLFKQCRRENGARIRAELENKINSL